MNSALTLRGPFGQLSLQPEGGMIGGAEFELPGIGGIKPLTCPEWRDRPGADTWLPLIRNFCGDFVCAPYGAPQIPADLPAEWRNSDGGGIEEDQWFHGHAVNATWEILHDPANPGRGKMTCRPPAPHPFEEVSRDVGLLGDGAGYQVDLKITARAHVAFPLSLHPCFTLPERPGALRLEIPRAGRGWTYPLALVPDFAPIALNARFSSLDAIPKLDGGFADFTHLPPAQRCEALVQIPAPAGEVRLIYDHAGYAVHFNYNATLLPSLVIWVSNCGRDEAPFDGTFRTLGIEAVAGAFDLGPHVSTSPSNPIAQSGLSSFVELPAGEQLLTRSTVRIEAL